MISHTYLLGGMHLEHADAASLKNRSPDSFLNEKILMQYVHRYQWRRSCDNDLFTGLGQECKKFQK